MTHISTDYLNSSIEGRDALNPDTDEADSHRNLSKSSIAQSKPIDYEYHEYHDVYTNRRERSNTDR